MTLEQPSPKKNLGELCLAFLSIPILLPGLQTLIFQPTNLKQGGAMRLFTRSFSSSINSFLALLLFISCRDDSSKISKETALPAIKLKAAIPGERIIIDQKGAPVERTIASSAKVSLTATVENPSNSIKHIVIIGRLKCGCTHPPEAGENSILEISSKGDTPASSETKKDRKAATALLNFSFSGERRVSDAEKYLSCFEGEFYAEAISAANDTLRTPIFRIVQEENP